MNTLPAHSKLGASSAERWMSCPGSVHLISLIRGETHGENKGSSYAEEGTQAHELANYCLEEDVDPWMIDHQEITPDMARAVQVYLDYVRSRDGWSMSELKLHNPGFHELMYGTTDAACLHPGSLEIIDYKHGVGIVVEVEENPQIMYYAYMVISELGEAWKDDDPITLTICQPRVEWRDPIRSWETTVGHIRGWARDTLRPAMDDTLRDAYLAAGEHCRFCPAKLVCPAFLSVPNKYRTLSLDEIKAATDPMLAELLKDLSALDMARKALKDEAYNRMIRMGGKLEGWKVVRAKANRIFKDDAPLADVFGQDAWEPPKLKSPPKIEELKGGKTFVAEWAYTPDLGFDIVPVSDKRKAVDIPDGTEKWQKLVDNLKPRD